MFAVIFEVTPRKERWDEYLELAKFLKPELEKIDGFIDNERFSSRRTEGRVLSLSTWRDEKAVIRWRTLGPHHEVQAKGRGEVFADYHLRVGEIIADSAPPPGQTLAEQRLDETEIGAAKCLSLCELPPGQDGELGLPPPGSGGLVDHETFESIYQPGKLLLLAAWTTVTAARQWRPAQGQARHRLVRVIRDYGMFDRREAPQYYPPARR